MLMNNLLNDRTSFSFLIRLIASIDLDRGTYFSCVKSSALMTSGSASEMEMPVNITLSSNKK